MVSTMVSTVVLPKMSCPVLSLLTQPDRFVKLNAEKAPFFVEKLAASGLSEIAATLWCLGNQVEDHV